MQSLVWGNGFGIFLKFVENRERKTKNHAILYMRDQQQKH